MSQKHDLFENRRQFQLERMILFSDAVFAIAITLLVIEIRIPNLTHLDSRAAAWSELRNDLLEKFPEFFGFILSFWVIGQFWHTHHNLFGYVEDYNGKLIWLNLHMLFWIILVPFSSALNSHYGGLNQVWCWYSLNMFMIAVSLFWLWQYIGNPANKLSAIALHPQLKKMSQRRSLAVAVIFLSGGLLSFLNGSFFFVLSRGIYFLIFPAMALISRHFRKKMIPS
ncbi:MAG TPA: TMEM175 family protein [Sediminibacterium sp.]|nr:TMEM175 family protein [Sediminibacterium sp.]